MRMKSGSIDDVVDKTFQNTSSQISISPLDSYSMTIPTQDHKQGHETGHHSPRSPGPLVLTLTLDDSTQDFLTSLRAKYFPKHRNHLQAHITLFHAIPPHRQPELDSHLTSFCHSLEPFQVHINDPKKMGNRGVMLSVRDSRYSIEWIHRKLLNWLLDGVRGERDELTNQDKRNWGKTAHVTVLNKAENEQEVENCLEEVIELFKGMKSDTDRFGQKVGKAIGLEM